MTQVGNARTRGTQYVRLPRGKRCDPYRTSATLSWLTTTAVGRTSAGNASTKIQRSRLHPRGAARRAGHLRIGLRHYLLCPHGTLDLDGHCFRPAGCVDACFLSVRGMGSPSPYL